MICLFAALELCFVSSPSPFCFLFNDVSEFDVIVDQPAINPRSSVVMRKITGGNRSQMGADTREILMSMCETCKMHNENFLEESTRFMRAQLEKGVTSKT